MTPQQRKAMEMALKSHKNNERHRTAAETRYWCEQYKLLAQQAIKALAQQPDQEPVAWGKMNDDGSIYDCICPQEHARLEGEYTIPLYTTPQHNCTRSHPYEEKNNEHTKN